MRCLYVGQAGVIKIKIHLIDVKAVVGVCVIARIGTANAKELFRFYTHVYIFKLEFKYLFKSSQIYIMNNGNPNTNSGGLTYIPAISTGAYT